MLFFKTSHCLFYCLLNASLFDTVAIGLIIRLAPKSMMQCSLLNMILTHALSLFSFLELVCPKENKTCTFFMELSTHMTMVYDKKLVHARDNYLYNISKDWEIFRVLTFLCVSYSMFYPSRHILVIQSCNKVVATFFT